jgi:hypothetical protein
VTRSLPIVLTVLLLAHASVRAAYHQFTLQGHVTETSFYFPNIYVGDPFSVQYVVDSTDSDASPLRGRYAATHALFTFPNTSLTSNGFGAGLLVDLDNPPDGTDRVTYSDGSLHWDWRIRFTFPPDTLASDALPLTLPLSMANSATFEFVLFTPLLGAAMTSYSSIEVPEPAGALAALIVLLRARRRPAAR